MSPPILWRNTWNTLPELLRLGVGRAGRPGAIIKQYDLPPPLFQDIDTEEFELLFDTDGLRNGGDALTGYARMQLEEMAH